MEQLLDYRARLLKRFESLPADFAQVIAAIPEAEWHRGRAPDGRTVHALMAHVRDLETLAFLPRLRRILTEEDPALEAFPSHRWSESGYDAGEPMDNLLADYARACEETLQLIRNLDSAGWSRAGFHAPNGQRTAQWWVERALTHGIGHLEEIRAAEGR
ncbi:MAG: DinB family protein [Chloroflexi bacterium]|nr:DinB family protein [Chloroflexota bacterium]